MRKVLGTSKVSTGNKISVIELAAKELKIKKGDHVAFFKDNNKIIIEKA